MNEPSSPLPIDQDVPPVAAEENTKRRGQSYKDFLAAIDQQDKIALERFFKDEHSADLADYIEMTNHDQRVALFTLIPTLPADILTDVDVDILEDIRAILGDNVIAQALSTMDVEDAVQVMATLDDEGQQAILEEIPHEQRVSLQEGLAYPEDSVGRIANKQFIAIPEYWTVGQTIDHFRSFEELPTDFYEVLVISPKYAPIGGVLVSKILCSKRDVFIKHIMHEHITVLNTHMDQEEAAYLFKQYGLASAPVVNQEGRLIGTVSLDDIVEIIEEEAEEDILRLGGISETDIYSSFMSTTIRRFPWLFINLLTAILASYVIGIFEDTIDHLVALAVLMPIVASMGGNAGTQTVTVAVRALATKDLSDANAMRVIAKEALVGLLNGIAFAVIAGAVVALWFGNATLSIVFALAMIVTLLLAGLMGAVIPLLLNRFHTDPAIGSSVFLTTVTDVSAFAVFLGLAAWILM